MRSYNQQDLSLARGITVMGVYSLVCTTTFTVQCYCLYSVHLITKQTMHHMILLLG